MISPAINAPSASDKPIEEVSQATEKHITTIERINSSLFFVFAIWYNRLGTIYLAVTRTNIMMSTTFKVSSTKGKNVTDCLPDKNGTDNIIGTTMIS